MILNIFRKRTIILLALLVIFVLVLALGQSLTQPQTEPGRQQLLPQPSGISPLKQFSNSKGIVVTEIQPRTGAELNAGDNIQLVLTLNNAIGSNQLSANLSAQSALDNEPAEDIAVKIGTRENKVVVEADEDYKPYTNYTFSLFLKPDELIYTKTYFVEAAPRPVVIQNDDTLLPYLPYTGEFFKLDYIPVRNVYIFTLLSDPQKPGDYQSQLKKGLAELDQLISKYGADKDEMVIEYKY